VAANIDHTQTSLAQGHRPLEATNKTRISPAASSLNTDLLAENPTCNSPTMLVTTEETKMRSTTVEVEMVISPQMSGISRFFSFIAGLLKYKQF